MVARLTDEGGTNEGGGNDVGRCAGGSDGLATGSGGSGASSSTIGLLLLPDPSGLILVLLGRLSGLSGVVSLLFLSSLLVGSMARDGWVGRVKRDEPRESEFRESGFRMA